MNRRAFLQSIGVALGVASAPAVLPASTSWQVPLGIDPQLPGIRLPQLHWTSWNRPMQGGAYVAQGLWGAIVRYESGYSHAVFYHVTVSMPMDVVRSIPQAIELQKKREGELKAIHLITEANTAEWWQLDGSRTTDILVRNLNAQSKGDRSRFKSIRWVTYRELIEAGLPCEMPASYKPQFSYAEFDDE